MKKNDRGFSVIELLVVIVVVGILVVIGWYVSGKKSTPSKTSAVSSRSQQAVIDTLAQELTTKISYLDANTDAWVAQSGIGVVLHNNAYAYSLSSVSFPTVNFYEKEGIVQYAHPEEYKASVNGGIDTFMKSRGFKQTTKTYTITMPYGDSPAMEYVVYTASDVTCVNIFYTLGVSTTVSCFTPSDIDAAFTAAQSYVETYVKANPSIAAANIVFGPLVVKSQNGAGVISSTHEAGYDISEAVIETNSARKLALFYNHEGGPWTYITQANDEFGFTCGSYTANATIRKVMYDQICLSENGQVRLDTHNRALQ